MATTTRLTGTIKTIKRDEGFGFIAHSASGQEYFFHRTALERTGPQWRDGENGTKVEEDDRVEFDPIDGPKGLRAVGVRVIR